MIKRITILVIGLLAAFGTMQAQTVELWGMTSKGGEFDNGTIFKTDINGENLETVYEFFKVEGSQPYYTKLCEFNGKLYGMTTIGGTSGLGVLFEYDPNSDVYTKKIDFDGIERGSKPYGSLILATNGKLYGITREGGASNYGVIFEFDPTSDMFTKLYDFDGTNGKFSYGSLMQATNGKLYGMTYQGGTYNMGVLFEYDVVNHVFTKKIDFDGSTKGSSPNGDLIQASDNKLYGMTSFGGTSSNGVIFQYDPTTNTYDKKFDFDSSTGRKPYGSLIQTTDGMLYGMTTLGGSADDGVLFQFDVSNNTYTTKIDFNGSEKGSSPYGSLMQASNGKLYGMTLNGGDYSSGVIFEYDYENATFTKKYDFNNFDSSGRFSFGTLMQASNGKLYGLTNGDGYWDDDCLFEFDINQNIYTKKIGFGESPQGAKPWGSLLQADNGNLYGMTSGGGQASERGVLFEYNPNADKFTVKVEFNGTEKGSSPYGSLIQAENGKLYGMTLGGGTYSDGVLFEYNPITEIYTKLIDFSGAENGSDPYGSLIEASNGKLYGLTNTGGAENMGIIFEYTPGSNTFVKKHDFGVNTDGSHPFGSLFQASNGKLYGMTRNGGTLGYGIIFEFNPNDDTYTQKHDFDDTNGKYPYGALIEVSDGQLYGMTSSGETGNYSGVIFEYAPSTNEYTLKFNFEYAGTNGKIPYGSLMQSSNGNLYGLTLTGGDFSEGVLFEFNPLTGDFIKKIDFNGTNGSSPYYTNLIEVTTSPVTNSNILQKSNINIYPNPTNGIVNLEFEYNNVQKVIVSDITGKQIIEKTSVKQNEQIDLSGFVSGIYIISIQTDKEIFTTKIIKE